MISGFKIAIFLILAFVLNTHAQFFYSENEKQIQNDIFNLDSPKISSFSINKPNGIINWLKVYSSFVYYETTANIVSLDSIINEIDKQRLIIEKLNSNDPYYNYCLADIHLMNCYLHFDNSNVLRSMTNYWSAKKYIAENIEKYPDFKLNYKHQLIIKVIDDWVNENVFGKKTEPSNFWQTTFQNEWQQALNSQNAESVTYREIELVGHLLQLIFGNVNSEKESRAIFPIDTYYSKGPLEACVSAILFNKLEKYPQTMKVLHQADSLGYNNKLNALNLLIGIAWLNKLSPLSKKYLEAFIINQANSNQTTYARLKLTWYYLSNRDFHSADSLELIIKKTNKAEIWDDVQALYEIKNSDFWIPEIINSRLYFDGGDYSNSIATLMAIKKHVNSLNKVQKLEYSYRLARAYHKSGNPIQAIVFYQMAIGSELDREFYYPAYSAFYLGEIFRISGDKENALKYYNICLQLDSPIYQTSIHKKAKNAKEMVQ